MDVVIYMSMGMGIVTPGHGRDHDVGQGQG